MAERVGALACWWLLLLTFRLFLLLPPLLLLVGVQARDPIPQLKRIMLEQGLASEDDIKAIHDRWEPITLH
jgi:hypothetical protein